MGQPSKINPKIILTPTGTVKISDTNSASTSSSQNGIYSVLDRDIFDDVDELNDLDKIQIDDELHLIGDGSNTPLLNPKAVALLVVNFVSIVLSVTWLIVCDFRIDIISTIFISLSVWTLAANLLTAIRILKSIKEQSIVAGKPNEFRDYVLRVNDPAIIITPQNDNNRWKPSSYFTIENNTSSQPTFV